MKILHLIGWYFPDSIGGTEVYVASLCERQVSAGHRALVAAPSRVIDSPTETYEHQGVPVFRYRIARETTREEAQHATSARGSEVLRSFLESERPDIVHVHALVTGISLFEVAFARALGCRIVVTNHLPSLGYLCQRGTLLRWGETPCDGQVTPIKCASCVLHRHGLSKTLAYLTAFAGNVWPSQSAGRLGTALGMPDLIRQNLRRQQELLDACDRFVVLNQNAADVLVSNVQTHGKLRINRLGVARSDLAPANTRRTERGEGSPIRFGYLGRMVEGKGLLTLARAFRRLDSRLDVELEIRGPAETSEEKNLVSEARRIIADDPRVRFGPLVSREKVFDWLRALDVLLVPSLWAEGGPTVAFEAQAVGTPVVGTCMGAMPEVIDHGVNGALLEPADWRALSHLMEELVSEPSILDSWRGAQPTPRTMDDIATDYATLYQECLEIPRS